MPLDTCIKTAVDDSQELSTEKSTVVNIENNQRAQPEVFPDYRTAELQTLLSTGLDPEQAAIHLNMEPDVVVARVKKLIGEGYRDGWRILKGHPLPKREVEWRKSVIRSSEDRFEAMEVIGCCERIYYQFVRDHMGGEGVPKKPKPKAKPQKPAHVVYARRDDAKVAAEPRRQEVERRFSIHRFDEQVKRRAGL